MKIKYILPAFILSFFLIPISIVSAQTEAVEKQNEDQLVQDEDYFVSVDESISTPELRYMIKMGVQLNYPIEEVIEMKSGDKMTLVGTSVEQATIVIGIGDSVYKVVADEVGDWELKIDTISVDEGDYTVKAQAQVNENMGSRVVELYEIEIVYGEERGKSPLETEILYPTLWEKIVLGQYRVYTITALCVILVILFILLFYTIIKKESSKGSTGEELFKPKELVKTFSAKEVAKHRSKDDAWLVIDGKVYDITEFAKNHPGGEVIVDGLGRDSTECFEKRLMGSKTPHTKAARVLLQKYYIGDLR